MSHYHISAFPGFPCYDGNVDILTVRAVIFATIWRMISYVVNSQQKETGKIAN